MSNKIKGFSIIELIVIIVILAVVGIIGWKAYDVISNNAGSDTTGNVVQAPEINNASDLDKASSALDSTDIDGSESSQIDSEVSF